MSWAYVRLQARVSRETSSVPCPTKRIRVTRLPVEALSQLPGFALALEPDLQHEDAGENREGDRDRQDEEDQREEHRDLLLAR